MVNERICNKVAYTVMKDVVETQIRKVPYTKCTVVKETLTKQVAAGRVRDAEVHRNPAGLQDDLRAGNLHRRGVRAEAGVQKTVPCVVTKWVKVTEPEIVCVKRLQVSALRCELCSAGLGGLLPPAGLPCPGLPDSGLLPGSGLPGPGAARLGLLHDPGLPQGGLPTVQQPLPGPGLHDLVQHLL